MELKNEGILDKFHADVEENDGILCIDSNYIVLKCIVRAFNNLICEISENIIDGEHDWFFLIYKIDTLI